jgi:uncharacterized protein DUF4389
VDASSPYSLRLEGEPSAHLSRWLWIVKLLLNPPRGGAVLPVDRVPRLVGGGALRDPDHRPLPPRDIRLQRRRDALVWRVGFYSFSALGTDAYPPFTLADVPDYPAHLSVDYPQQLSRGLALVKWWLLAFPRYLIIGVFTGGAFAGYNEANGGNWRYGAGLIRLLLCIVGVALLFADRYPRGLYDLVMAMNRWCFRVVAYAALMTDQYPPFRLDLGGHEPPADAIGTTGPAPLPAS